MSSDSPCSVQDSILKLRSLREKLCKNDVQWKKAFEVRDHVISSLEALQCKLEDKDTPKAECAIELRRILRYFEDNNNV